MAVLEPADIPDLGVTTLTHYERGKWTDISTSLRRYHVFPNLILFKDDKGNSSRFETRQGGLSITFDLMVNYINASRNVGMNPEDAPADGDVMDTGTVPWRWTTTQWWIAQQAKMLNSSEPDRINNYEKTKEIAAMISLAVLMENNFWGAPVSATDESTPYGVFTWLPKGSTAGFNGGFPSGFTTLGLDNEHANWKHYTFPYVDMTPQDGIRATWLAMLATEFTNPVSGIPNLDGPMDRGMYVNTATYIAVCEAAKNQNDQVGYDLGMNGRVPLLNGVPYFAVPKLDADTTDPIVLLDWGTMKCVALAWLWLKKLIIKNYPGRHLSDAHFMDSGFNFVNWNRRKNAVGAKGTTYPA